MWYTDYNLDLHIGYFISRYHASETINYKLIKTENENIDIILIEMRTEEKTAIIKNMILIQNDRKSY